MPSAMEDVRLEASRIYAIVFTNNGSVFYRSSFEALQWETNVRNCKMKSGSMQFDFIYDNSKRILPDGTVEVGDFTSILPTTSNDELGSRTIQDLRSLAKREGISVSGDKNAVIAAIRENRHRNAVGSVD